jgi:hypothetical protein
MLTLPQASKLTGRHEDTIRRLVKRLLKTDQVAKEKIIQEKTIRGFHYLIDQEYLVTKLQPLQASNKGGGKTSSNQPKHQPSNNVAHQPLQTNLQPSYAELKAKDETIAILKKQLEQKDEQISHLLERGRETNILLKGYQDRYLLEAPKQTTGKNIVGSTAAENLQSTSEPRKPHKLTKQPPKPKQQQQKKGFFSWFK